ncbi:Uncharacterised protein [Xylophilus ampelinus]|nr:DUF2501 domain-containing protein [Variovorax sp.]VTY39947.1 Uncharacterised protein [Xylophilus ampelinus]|tara:strand:+ start:237 stop:659 length:423 start_codon:yes stop_codon:yes gene_type:complete
MPRSLRPSLRIPAAATLVLAAALATPVHANKLMDAMKDQLANSGIGNSLPAIGASTAGNAAGVIQYCVKNNYLDAANANGIKDKLMGMVTGQKPQQTGYANGAKGLLMGSDGQSLNLKGLSGKLKEKACDYVLKNATKLF